MPLASFDALCAQLVRDVVDDLINGVPAGSDDAPLALVEDWRARTLCFACELVEYCYRRVAGCCCCWGMG